MYSTVKHLQGYSPEVALQLRLVQLPGCVYSRWIKCVSETVMVCVVHTSGHLMQQKKGLKREKPKSFV